MGRYQIGKTNLDFTEARDIEWQWYQLGHMQACTFLPPNQQRQSTEGISSVKVIKAINSGRKILANLCFMGR